MQEILCLDFAFCDNNALIEAGIKKQIDVIFTNNSLYDMQLFCSLDLPFGFSCDKSEFDVICPAQGKTFASIFVTLKKDAYIFYEKYTFKLTVFDTVSESKQVYDFQLYNSLNPCTTLKDNQLLFNRVYICENDTNVVLSVHAEIIISVKLANTVLFENNTPTSDLKFPVTLKKGINQLQILHTVCHSKPIEVSFSDNRSVLNLPFIIQ